MLAVEAEGKDIRTVEGLVAGTVLHPVQQALCDHDGTMCGFCTPGFVMSAVSLLERHPNPTAEQARAALDGNICRCGTYPQVLEAVLDTKGVRRG
jgi:aerobic-type carbon monoxide dehydrogenase small subunit (CoxS/CutS family)